jgi:hypothetical protein
MTGPGPVTAHYRLGGVPIEVRCTEARVGGLVDRRLRSLRSRPGPDPVVVDIRGPGADRTWPPFPDEDGRPVYDAPGGSIRYADAADELFVDYEGRARLVCAPGRRLIQLGITGPDQGDEVLAAHPLLTIAMLEMMKRLGHFPLHAACVSSQGSAVLLAGTSGAGKSTLSVALTRAGADFLSDDTVFITSDADGPAVYGFADEVDVTDTTISMFPELAHLADEPRLPGRDKASFRIEEVFASPSVAAARPVAIVTPRLTPGTRSELAPLAPSDARLELLPNVLLTDPVSSQAHLDLLAQLVHAVPCFTLRLGTDLEAAASCVLEVLR